MLISMSCDTEAQAEPLPFLSSFARSQVQLNARVRAIT